ncbi:hypothetical protein QN352_17535 [Mucilaginibacter sp. 10I4]|nr:hypothetical protein [Mucilaginibacter sp. 10I4]
MQVLFNIYAYGQANNPSIGQVITNIQNYYKAYPAEKLYLQTDRPYYTVTDTIWFKAWLFNASSYTPSKLSGKLYVELINDSSTVISRFTIPIKMGLGNGQVVLGKQLADGNYTLRAYTNWMQNFSSDAFFSKTIYIGKPLTTGNWLINEQHSIANGNTVDLYVTLTNLNNLPVTYNDVELKLLEGDNTLFKGNYVTGDDGKVHSKIELPVKPSGKQFYLNIIDKTTKNSFKMPFYPSGTMQNIDLQFMPEGGQLVAGLTSRVGFKAIGENGLGVDLQGTIADSRGKQAGIFKSGRKGMGNFILLPKTGETYTANYNINGIMHSADLPKVMPEGMALKVGNLANPDSVLVHITATSNLANQNKQYVLLAQSAGGVYLGAKFTLQNGFNNMAFAKGIFVSGIVNFTIFDGAHTIAQRKIFIDHHDRLTLDLGPSHNTWQTNDSIAITVNVLDAAGKPVKGNFAASVTDNALVKEDSLQENIVSRLLLTSEIKGNIENPSWYFASNDDHTAPALDNLMLTQGWTGYDETLFLQPTLFPKFLAEPDNSVTGRITGLFNKPLKNTKVSIFTTDKKYGIILIDTISDANGRFKLRDLPPLDTVIYHIKATSLKGKELGATFALDNFKPAKVDIKQNIALMPWYTRNDSAISRYYNKPPQELTDIDPSDVKGKLLEQVVIKGSKPVDAKTYIPFLRKSIDEKTLIESGNINLRDLLAKKFNSLHIVGYYTPDKETELYLVGHNILADVKVDGQSMRRIYNEQFVSTFRSFLYTVPASEIKNIRIYDGLYSVITIETRGGTGLNTFPTPGLIIYHPIPYNLPMRFYNPKYKASNASLQNPRPTVYWEPNLVTDANGKATLSFYAADKPSTYIVNIQGTDLQGRFGVQTLKIKISGNGK